MNPDDKNKNLDELIKGAIGRDGLKFDFDKWKDEHKEEVQIYKSQKTEQNIRFVPIYKMGRIIMKSPIAKFAVAAVIIFVVVIIFQNGFVATPAFGLNDISDAMEKIEWLHCVRITEKFNEEGSLGDTFEMWQSAKPSLTIEKHSDGKIKFKENKTGKIFIYDPEPNTITVKYDENFDPREAYESLSDWFRIELAQINTESDNVKYKEGFLDEQPVKIITYDINPELKGVGVHYIISIAVYPDTYLPKQMSIEQNDSKEGKKTKTTGTFDYPQSGPKDIYEAGAPRNTKVVIIDKRE